MERDTAAGILTVSASGHGLHGHVSHSGWSSCVRLAIDLAGHFVTLWFLSHVAYPERSENGPLRAD